MLPRDRQWRYFRIDEVSPQGLGKDFLRRYNKMHSAHGLRDRPLLKKSAMQSTKKVGRNDPCPCGSDKKFKKCYSGTEAALVH